MVSYFFSLSLSSLSYPSHIQQNVYRYHDNYSGPVQKGVCICHESIQEFKVRAPTDAITQHSFQHEHNIDIILYPGSLSKAFQVTG